MADSQSSYEINECFTGKLDTCSSPGCEIYVGQEIREFQMGHLGLLNIKKLVPGYPDMGGSLEYWRSEPHFDLMRAMRATREQNGMVVWCHVASLPGAEYYKNIVEGEKDTPVCETATLLFPWLAEELEVFARSDARELNVEKQVTTDRGERSFTIRFSRMLDVSSKFQGSIINLTDITEQKNTEKQLREQEKLQGVLQMAGAICHELTQPMQAICGNAELLLMTMPENDTKSKKVKNILSQMGRMNNITRKLQAMTRCETKPYVLGSEIIDIYGSSN